MLPIRTEGEANEIALVGLVAEARIGKFGDLIGVEIQHGDRLLRARLLRAVAVVQQRGVVAIGAEHHRRGEAVGAADAARCRNG